MKEENDMKLYCTVESPDGYVWEQAVEWHEGESVSRALSRYKGMLGRGYLICDWRIS